MVMKNLVMVNEKITDVIVKEEFNFDHVHSFITVGNKSCLWCRISSLIWKWGNSSCLWLNGIHLYVFANGLIQRPRVGYWTAPMQIDLLKLVRGFQWGHSLNHGYKTGLGGRRKCKFYQIKMATVFNIMFNHIFARNL